MQNSKKSGKGLENSYMDWFACMPTQCWDNKALDLFQRSFSNINEGMIKLHRRMLDVEHFADLIGSFAKSNKGFAGFCQHCSDHNKWKEAFDFFCKGPLWHCSEISKMCINQSSHSWFPKEYFVDGKRWVSDSGLHDLFDSYLRSCGSQSGSFQKFNAITKPKTRNKSTTNKLSVREKNASGKNVVKEAENAAKGKSSSSAVSAKGKNVVKKADSAAKVKASSSAISANA